MSKNKYNSTSPYPFHEGAEAEQYAFIRVPKIFLHDPALKEVSWAAKILYGLMMDRMELSIKNQWHDEDNHVFIYFTVEEIMETLGCGNKKAGALLAELDDKKGVGLITRVRQGLGRPDKIYVRKFIREEGGPEEPEEESENEPEHSAEHPQTCQNDTSGHAAPEIPQRTSQTCQNDISGRVETTSADMAERHAINTDKNHTEKNKTESIKSDPLPLDDADRFRLEAEFLDVDRLIDKALCGVKAREIPTKIRNPYKYIRQVARNENWPTKAKAEEQKARREAGIAAQAQREKKLEAEEDEKVAAARKAGFFDGRSWEGGVLHV